jgi:hypothetical protein
LGAGQGAPETTRHVPGLRNPLESMIHNSSIAVQGHPCPFTSPMRVQDLDLFAAFATFCSIFSFPATSDGSNICVPDLMALPDP